MVLVLGVKAHYNDVKTALKLSRSLELHEDLVDVNDEGLKKQADAFKIFDTDSIDSLSIHCPMTSKRGAFDLCCDGDEDEIARRTLALGDSLAKYASPIVFVFHANGTTLDLNDHEKRKKVIADLANKVNAIAGADRRITIENTTRRHWPNLLFAGIEDFSMLFESSEKRVGMTLDICHFFMEHLNEGYGKLEDLIESYDDKIFNIHISDMKFSKPKESEGTQIGEGDLDFDRVFDLLSDVSSDLKVNVIPEIRDGHKNNCAGFRTAVGRLKEYF